MKTDHRPFVRQLIIILADTQDGRKLEEGDKYSQLVLDLIKENTDGNRVNVAELSGDLSYALDQITKVKKELDKYFSWSYDLPVPEKSTI